TVLTGAYMARALRLLWHGDAGKVSGNGVVWMGAGIAVLVVLAALLGAGFGTIEHLLDAELPASGWAVVLGLSAALSGLALGWFVSGARLLGPIRLWAQSGFAVAGGFDGVMLRPAMAIAQACERLERALYNGALAFGRLNLRFGYATRQSDERGIDGMIFGLVRQTIAAGGRVRRLQSGLIHRELALTVVGIAVVVAVLIATPLYY
ncbi:MAG: NADH-quinone oxidoreductase subunit L, partial [Paracoccaceae bacterium]